MLRKHLPLTNRAEIKKLSADEAPIVPFTRHGKSIYLGKQHIADAENEEIGAQLCDALNWWREFTAPVPKRSASPAPRFTADEPEFKHKL